jgi:hypothetical protein
MVSYYGFLLWFLIMVSYYGFLLWFLMDIFNIYIENI